nr:EOG090X0HQJ [Lepidurus arcticus]
MQQETRFWRKISLKFFAFLEKFSSTTDCGESRQYSFPLIRCQNCQEITGWHYITQSESVPLKGSRSSANIVLKCKLCSRENSISILPDKGKSYSAADQETFKTVVSFECRGAEPTDFSPRNGWDAEAESGANFTDIDLSDKEWADYDERGQQTVGVYEVTHQFIREK